MSTPSGINLRDIESILVIKLDRLGDFVLASSFLRELRRNAPQARIDLLVTKEIYRLAELCPYVDCVLMTELLNGNLMITGEPDEDVRACLMRFEQTGYDLAVVPRWDYDYWRASIIARASRARCIVGFKTPAAHNDKYQTDELYTHLLDRPFVAHEVEHNLSIVPFLGGSVADERLEVWTSPKDEEAALRLIEKCPGDGPLVAICPGASLARKMVPHAKLARILKRAGEMAGPFRCVVLGSPQDSKAGNVLSDQLKSSYDLCGQTTIRETAALIAKCHLLIGMDSAGGHMAAALGVPSLIFSCFEQGGNPIEDCSPARWRPFGPAPSVVLQPPASLWPCKDVCRQEYGHCIMTIEDGRAAREISKLLGVEPSGPHPLDLTPAEHRGLPALSNAVQQGRLGGNSYLVGGLVIEMPFHHTLPALQQEHPLYDRFLPFLAPFAPPDSWIIDVGANIGDTVASIVSVTGASILAIEGHPSYFAYLAQNVAGMPDNFRSRVQCSQALVGTGDIAGEFRAENGTARIIEAESSQMWERKQIDEVLAHHSIPPQHVFLLKSDTDGYDADVLLSASKLIREHNPVLYFENQIDTPAQAHQFASLYHRLAASGYLHYWVFDNFGNLLLEDVGPEVLPSLNQYLVVQQQKRSTRTLYYYDILAAKPSRTSSIAQAIHSYKQFMLPEMAGESSTTHHTEPSTPVLAR
ncbi:MAG TPA: FkbM family methyltransferase [Bryobacteraceae bacterium]|nr:FkbM family methyltransferase [Bryobacteraceae bacterium]